MSRPRLFVELCAGLAAVSLRLQGGDRCRPPVSRMGSKVGYARAILGALGLHSGQGSDGYLWTEPDNGCRALLQAYGQPDVLQAAADVIRDEWADEEPRALWERLRALGPIRGVDGREVARWATIQRWTYAGAPSTFQRGQWVNGNGKQGGHTFGANNFGTTATTARAIDALPDLPATVVGADARTVDPREVARWVLIRGWTNGGGLKNARWAGPGRKTDGTTGCLTRPGLAARLASLPALPPTVVGADAREIDPPPLDGVVVFLDPPYQNTTKYAHDLDRAAVLELARRWDRAGATVAISEQEPLTGWADRVWSVDISAARRGQRRTFSRQQAEWLSINRPPVETPAQQIDLFAGAT